LRNYESVVPLSEKMGRRFRKRKSEDLPAKAEYTSCGVQEGQSGLRNQGATRRKAGIFLPA